MKLQKPRRDYKMKRTSFFLAIALMFLATFSVYAQVEVTNIEDNKGGTYTVGVIEEDGLFFHDRDYIMHDIPEEFLGLTQIKTSCDCPGGQDYRLTFEIDRSAFVYTAWDSRHKRPEERGQEPEDWFTDNYEDTGKILIGDVNPTADYWIYKSKEPYPKGKVEFFGIDTVVGDPVIMWTIFLEGGTASVQPGEKLTTTWSKVKSLSF